MSVARREWSPATLSFRPNMAPLTLALHVHNRAGQLLYLGIDRGLGWVNQLWRARREYRPPFTLGPGRVCT
jgi:hypothetical protein